MLRQGVRIAGDEFVGCCIVAALRARHLYIEHGIVHLPHYSLAASKHWGFGMVEERKPQVDVFPLGTLVADVAEDAADVLAFVMPHFADRFPLENFVILDERRAVIGIHPAGKTWFLTKLSKQELETLQQAGRQKDENEQEIEVLFQSFCRSLSILERQNQPLQQQLVPLKYRMHMTEFQKK